MMWFYVTHVAGIRYSRCKDEIKDLAKIFKMSRQSLRSFQDIQEFKIFLRSWRDIQDVERWVEISTVLTQSARLSASHFVELVGAVGFGGQRSLGELTQLLGCVFGCILIVEGGILDGRTDSMGVPTLI